MTFAALQPLADRAALFVALRQDALSAAADALGEHRWDADLAAGTLTFTADADPSRQLVARAHLIATIAPGPRSLLWAWAHPSGDPQGVAAQLHAYGNEHGVAELTTAEVAFPAEVSGDDEWIAQAAHTVGGVAVELTGRSPYYSAPVGNGTRAVFLLDAPLAPLTVADAVIALPACSPPPSCPMHARRSGTSPASRAGRSPGPMRRSPGRRCRMPREPRRSASTSRPASAGSRAHCTIRGDRARSGVIGHNQG